MLNRFNINYNLKNLYDKQLKRKTINEIKCRILTSIGKYLLETIQLYDNFSDVYLIYK